MISNTNSNKLKSIESNISLPVLSPLSPSPTPTKLPSQAPIYIPTDAPVNQHKRKATTVPTLKPKRSANTAINTELPSELGKLVQRDVALLKQLGWTKFVQHRRRRGDFASLDDVHHPAKRLLRHYKNHGAPVKFSTKPWTQGRIKRALARGPHKSCHEYLEFLQEEFVDMINKQQWVILPASEVMDLPGLRLSPPGCVPQRDRRPRWICDYSWSEINAETLALAAMESMQFGHALDRILREILLADPRLGPIYLMKIDISDGFYRVNLSIDDIPKLGVVFPTAPGQEPLVALPLVLPMGWKNSPPIFSTVTETIADMANQRIQNDAYVPPTHHLDTKCESIPSPDPLPAPEPHGSRTSSVEAPISRDPCLPTQDRPLGYVDIFVDDFLTLAQGKLNRKRVRKILMQAIDQVIRPLQATDPATRREPISIKKLLQGDCSWGEMKIILGWVINTARLTIHLPEHRQKRLAEILASIPPTQKRTSVKKWHKVLGELRSMSIALPGSRNLFSQMQHALTTKLGHRISLKKGVHQAIKDFKWILKDISSRPTRIAELVPLLSSAEGHHDASGMGAGGVWFPSPHLPARRGFDNRPILWRLKWPQDIIDSLVTDSNPNGTISNSDLELAGGLLHLEALAQCFDIRERTVLSKTDNLATLFWQRKGSATTDKVPAYLLRLFGIHQRFHRYVPRHDYLSGSSNPLADDASRLFHLTLSQLHTHINNILPQPLGYQHWTPSPQIVSAVISALRSKPSKPESLLVEPNPPLRLGNSGNSTSLTWASIPFSKPSKTKYRSYKSSQHEFDPVNLQKKAIHSGLDRLKITYGSLPRRSLVWGT